MALARNGALYLLPPLTLLVGAGSRVISAEPDRVLAAAGIVPLGLAAVSPLLAVLVLSALDYRCDRILVATAGMLTGVGTSTLLSLSLTQERNAAFYQAIVTRHCFFVCAGFAALVTGAHLSRYLEKARKFPFTLLVVALVLTLVTIAFGESVNGARLWLRVGPVQFQPSEVARWLLVGFIVVYLYDRRHQVAAPWRIASLDLPPAPYLAPLTAAVLAAVGVLALQNDLGMAALVVLGTYATVSAAVGSRSALGLAGITLVVSAIASYTISLRVRERVAAWLQPWDDPAGRGFQFVQSEFLMASGGVLGEQATNGPARVPEVHTDFILIAIAAEWGWAGATAVLTLSAILVLRCLAAALRTTDGFRALVALGISAVLAIQILLICGGTLRILPLTGVTLPLTSYGGTSMIATLFALGVIAGIGAPERARRAAST